MANALNEHELWAELSDLFIDIEIEERLIARSIKDYPIEQIEIALFEKVGPVCVSNLMTTIPPVIWGFDKADLVGAIEELIEKRSRSWIIGRSMFRVKVWFIRRVLAGTWKRLKQEIIIAQRAS